MARKASSDAGGDLVEGRFIYRGAEADAYAFLEGVHARVATVAVAIRCMDNEALWLDSSGAEVARVRADQPVLQRLIAGWARSAAGRAVGQTENAGPD